MAGFNLFDFSNIPGTSVQKFGTGVSTPTQPTYTPPAQTAPTQTSKSFDSNDIAKFKDLTSKGIAPDRAKALILQAKGVSKPVTKQEPQDTSFLGALGESAKLIGKAVATPFVEAPRIAGNIVGLASDVGGFLRGQSKEEREAASGLVKGLGERVTSAGEKSIGLTEGQKTGARLITDVGSSLAVPGGILKSGVGIGQGILRGAGQGAIEMGKYTAVSEGRLPTATEAAVGGTLGAIAPVIGKGVEWATKKLPQALITKGMGTPSDILNASKRLSKLKEGGAIDVAEAPKWMLSKKLQGSYENIQSQLDDVAKLGSSKTKELLKNNTSKHTGGVVDELKDAIDEMLPIFQKKKVIGEGAEAIAATVPKAGRESIVNELKTLLSKKEWTLQEVNSARRLLADEGKIFKQGGDWSESVSKEGMQDVWLKASKFLDEKLPGFRVANKDVEVAMAMKESIALKQAQDQTRKLMTLTSGIPGVGGAAVGYQQGGVEGAIKGAALGFAGGILSAKILNNPAFTTKLATVLNKLGTESTPAKKAIETFIKSRGETTIPDALFQKISKAIESSKTLLPKSTKNATIRNSVIRPMTSNKLVTPKPIIKPTKINSDIQTMTKGDAILIKKGGKIYPFNEEAKQALKRSSIDVAEDGSIPKQITFYPDEDFRPDFKINNKVLEKPNPLDLSKNKKGFISPKAIGESVGIGEKVPDELKVLVEEAKKYKSAEEFISNIEEAGFLDKNSRGYFKYIDINDIPKKTSVSVRPKDMESIKGVDLTKKIPVLRITDGKIAITDGAHRIEASRANGVKKIPVFIQDKTSPNTVQDIFDKFKKVSEQTIPNQLYHGTSEKFSSFKEGAGSRNKSTHLSGFGTFFTESKDIAKQFGENIKSVSLNVNKLYDMTPQEFTQFKPSEVKEFRKYLESQGYEGIKLSALSKEDIPLAKKIFGENGYKEFTSPQYSVFDVKKVKIK